MDSYDTASDIYQSLPDWMPIYPLYTTTFAGIPGNTTWISHFLFYDISISPRGSDFFLLTWQLLSKTPRIKGRPVPPAMQRASGGSGSISRGLLFLPIRDTQVFISVWNDARAVGEGEQKRASERCYPQERISNEEDRQDTRLFIVLLELFVSEHGSFYYFSLPSFYGIKRVRITKSDSHLERKVLLHGNLEDLTFYVPH